jgi:hypothetical protein
MIRRDQRAAHERLQPVGALRRRFLQERGADLALPGAYLDPHLQPLGQRVDDVGRVERRLGVVLGSADGSQQHALAVDRHLELMLVLQAADRTEIDLEQLDLDDVLAVERKRMRGQQAAARARWQRLVLAGLRRVAANPVGLRAGSDVRTADGQRADLGGCRQVSLEQRRRQPEHVGVVVEAIRRIVRRQQRGRIDLQREQIANRVRVLGAVETMRGVPPGHGMLGRLAVECGLEIGDERVVRGRIGPRHTDGRHHAGAKPADDPFPDLGILGDASRVEAVEDHTRGGGVAGDPPVVTPDAVLVEGAAHVSGRSAGVTGRFALPRRTGNDRRSRGHPDGCRQPEQTNPQGTHVVRAGQNTRSPGAGLYPK